MYIAYNLFSASAVTPSEKSSIDTDRKSILSNEPNLNIVRCPKAPKGRLKNAQCRKILTTSCDNSETVRDRMSVNINY